MLVFTAIERLLSDSLTERISMLNSLDCGKKMSVADPPLILILSIYTDFLPFKFGKIRIFFLKIWENTDFFRNAKGFFLYLL